MLSAGLGSAQGGEAMNQAELSIFTEPDHPKMCGPFSLGDYSYATNGHILVRVSRLADVPEREALNEKAARMFDGLDFMALDAALVDIPNFSPPDPNPCPVCEGSGKVSTCPECKGAGEVTFENDFNEYECECLTCLGQRKVSGQKSICGDCNGTGNLRVVNRIAVGCSGFSSHSLSLMRNHLPGVKIAPTDPEKAAYFKWAGGDGMLMPMRA
jgi:hypothetical protein